MSYAVLTEANNLIPRGIKQLLGMGWAFHDSEDAAYEALYKTADRFDSEQGPLVPFYYLTLQFHASNYWHKARRYDALKIRYHTDLNPGQTHRETVLRHDVDWLLTTIPKVLAHTAHEIYRVGRTYEEAADLDKATMPAISCRMMRAKRMLRENWSHEMRGGK